MKMGRREYLSGLLLRRLGLRQPPGRSLFSLFGPRQHLADCGLRRGAARACLSALAGSSKKKKFPLLGSHATSSLQGAFRSKPLTFYICTATTLKLNYCIPNSLVSYAQPAVRVDHLEKIKFTERTEVDLRQ
jgi:hypothetical protein